MWVRMREKCLKTETFKVKMIVFTRALLYSLLYMWQFPVFRRDTDIPMHVLTCTYAIYGSQWRFFKWANPGLFLIYFWSFQTNNTIFKTIQCENVTSSLRCADLNPQPLEHESSPITNRPGLPPNNVFLNLFMYANLTYYFLHSSSVALPKARALKQSLSILNTWFIIVCGQRPKT